MAVASGLEEGARLTMEQLVELLASMPTRGERQMRGAPPATIDAYVEALPERSRQFLEDIRKRLRTAAPGAVDGIKYGMPTATLSGRNIIYYAAWKNHVGLYPVYLGEPEFEASVAPYRDKKDTVRFNLDKPLPGEIIDLILANQLGSMRANVSKRESRSNG